MQEKGKRRESYMAKGNLIRGNIVTAQDLKKFLKLSEQTVYKLASEGELPGFKIGDSWRFEVDEILKLFHGSNKEAKNTPRQKLKKEGT